MFKVAGIFIISSISISCNDFKVNSGSKGYNTEFEGEFLNRIAFPMGGIGAGMICLEGTGAISHVSVRNSANVFYEPFLMAAISIEGMKNGTKVVEGPVPQWKVFGNPGNGTGSWGKSYGFPRFEKAIFKSRFPFGNVILEEKNYPIKVSITGWSPFIPTDEDNSSLPVCGLEYSFENYGQTGLKAAFSYHAENIMKIPIPNEWGRDFETGHSITGIKNGFVLKQNCLPGQDHLKGEFAIFTDEPENEVDLCWFRGDWFDSKTVLWKELSNLTGHNDTTTINSPGASIYVPFILKPGEIKTIRLLFAWYTPFSNIREGLKSPQTNESKSIKKSNCSGNIIDYYSPWYAGKYQNLNDVINYWKNNYNLLRKNTGLFTNSFYNSSLPPELIESVANNLSILKSPTLLRQRDGKLWAYEGCHDNMGCCYGSCTHVWNYAQAIAHLFPALERTLRETEFIISQNDEGHQAFRTSLPIQPLDTHDFNAAADGQLGGIMKVYRDWRISGDSLWVKNLYPFVKKSMDYCIKTWDPKHKGIIEEPHHNTYDIEFWGPNGMITSYYLGALTAMTELGSYLNDDVSEYLLLQDKGKKIIENDLFNGEYFIQKIILDGLEANDPIEASITTIRTNYSPEAISLLKEEGPKYQYGNGCLSDGILGAWIGEMAGLESFIDETKVLKHINSVYKYNFRENLSYHVNPQRPSYALGNEGGLILCSWPNGNDLTLPFVYSNEIWTGIEYQVASHLMSFGEVEKGLNIVRQVRNRYDGRTRNPFNEYECGHWYGRALSSYGLLQGLTGVRYDGVNQTLFVDSQIGNFKTFISTNQGFGNILYNNGKVEVKVAYGKIPVKKIIIN